MTRKEYQLVFEALKSYKTFMTDQEKVLSEKILDDLFYQDRVDNEIKSLNFRQEIIMKTLKLTDDQFEVLYDLLEETILDIQSHLDEDIGDVKLDDYEIYHVWKQLDNYGGK